MKHLLPVTALALALAGCATPRASAPSGTWTLQASATSGAALALPDASGGDRLRIACRRNPMDLYLASDAATAARGAVTLHVDDHVFPLTTSTDESRLAATGPVPAALPAALMSARSVSVSYPGGRLGPYAAPDPKTAAAFTISCRG